MSRSRAAGTRRPRGRRPALPPAERRLAERLPLVVYACAFDVPGAFTYMSPRVEALTGYPARAWTGDPRLWLTRVHPEDRAAVLREIGRARRETRPLRLHYRLVDRWGAERFIRDEAELRPPGDGGPPGLDGVWIEVTQERASAAELSQRRREAEHAREQMQRLLRYSSHTLRTPLRQVQSLADLALSRLDEASPARDLVARAAAAGQGMQRLVEGLASYADAVCSPLRLTEVDADSVLLRALDDLRPLVESSKAVVSREALPAVRADAGKLRAVLLRLLENALRFSGDQPRVHVWARRHDEGWLFSVRDHGRGIEHARARRLFDAYREGPREGESSGLGLAICRELVERLGGRLWVESEPGVGSTFCFTLADAPQTA